MIYLITGASGSGKSTISIELAKRLKRSFYIEVDDLRKSVISGYSSPQDWSEETSAQFKMATESAIFLAKNADKYDFDVVIDDTVLKQQETMYFEELPDAFRVWVSPDLDTVLERNRKRKKNIDEDRIRKMLLHLNKYRRCEDWLKLDTTDLTVEESVDEIIKQSLKSSPT